MPPMVQTSADFFGTRSLKIIGTQQDSSFPQKNWSSSSSPWPKNACLLPPSSTHSGFWIKYLTYQIKSDHFLEDPFIIYISFTTVQLRFHPDLEDLNLVRPHLWPPRPASGAVHRYGMLIQKLYSSVYIKMNKYELLRNMYVCMVDGYIIVWYSYLMMT